jgi:hypothetical protein
MAATPGVSGINSAEDHKIVGVDHDDGPQVRKSISRNTYETLAKDLAGLIGDLDGIIDREIT